MNDKSFNWHEALSHTYDEFTEQVISFAPQLISAIALLFGGWLLAIVMRAFTRKLVSGFDFLFQRASRMSGSERESIKRSYISILSNLVFWTVFIFFIAAAANMLGWKVFSNWMNSVITNYLPSLIAGLLIILAGFLLSNGARTAVISAAHSAGIEQGEMLARVVQIVILFTTLVIGIEQIGINVHFLTNVLIVIVGVLLAGGALAFSLGAKTLVANIIGAQYVRKHCRVGERMQIRCIEGGSINSVNVEGVNINGAVVEGIIVEVTQTSIILETDLGRTVVPAKYFQERVVSFVAVSGDAA